MRWVCVPPPLGVCPATRVTIATTTSFEAAKRTPLSFSADAAFFDLVQERLVADAELLGGATSVPVQLQQRLLDDRALRFDRGRLGDVGEPRAGSCGVDRHFHVGLLVVGRALEILGFA